MAVHEESQVHVNHLVYREGKTGMQWNRKYRVEDCSAEDSDEMPYTVHEGQLECKQGLEKEKGVYCLSSGDKVKLSRTLKLSVL
jgi:hypothetical protein